MFGLGQRQEKKARTAQAEADSHKEAVDAIIEMSPEELMRSAAEAIVIGRQYARVTTLGNMAASTANFAEATALTNLAALSIQMNEQQSESADSEQPQS